MTIRFITPVLALIMGATAAADNIPSGYPITPVPFTSVRIEGGFWGPRMEACRDVTIPLAFAKCEETGRYENFVRAADPKPEYHATGFPFDDTDVYKTIEGASYRLSTYPDRQLEAYIDSVISIVAKAQEPDGYLFTARTQNPERPHDWAKGGRWDEVEVLSHEFYNLGHLIESAVAHWQATGKRSLLDIAIRYADCVCREIGDGPGQRRVIPGHQIAEMALVKLYTVTGDEKYLRQAKWFLDARGTTAHRDIYLQSHKPVLEQDEAVGHAVRATYMYAGMADVAAITGDSAYIKAIDRIWDNITQKKLYITGGIGARHQGEAFGDNYELPNLTAYNETCAAIGNVYVNYRLFLLHGDSKYFDVLERTLYNGLISGVSIDGGRFFYPNPLASTGNYSRQAWFGCACCPGNVSRFLPSLPGYVYAVRDNDLYVNLFMNNEAKIRVGGREMTLRQTTAYPSDGAVALDIVKGSGRFAMKVRIPGWVRNIPAPGELYAYADGLSPEWSVKVNGVKVEGELSQGYLTIDRKWRKGDRVEIALDMPVRKVVADDRVADDRGRIAVERGPLVYCAEWCDNTDFCLHNTFVPETAEFSVEEACNDLGGIRRISAPVQVLSLEGGGRLAVRDCSLSLIPYYAWAHRGEGHMAVWLPASLQAASAVPPVPASREDNGFYK